MASKKQIFSLVAQAGATVVLNAEGKNKYVQRDFPNDITLELHPMNGSINIHRVNNDQFFHFAYSVYHIQTAPDYMLIFFTLAQIEKWAVEEIAEQAAKPAPAPHVYAPKLTEAEAVNLAQDRAENDGTEVYVILTRNGYFVRTQDEINRYHLTDSLEVVYVARPVPPVDPEDAEDDSAGYSPAEVASQLKAARAMNERLAANPPAPENRPGLWTPDNDPAPACIIDVVVTDKDGAVIPPINNQPAPEDTTDLQPGDIRIYDEPNNPVYPALWAHWNGEKWEQHYTTSGLDMEGATYLYTADDCRYYRPCDRASQLQQEHSQSPDVENAHIYQFAGSRRVQLDLKGGDMVVINGDGAFTVEC